MGLRSARLCGILIASFGIAADLAPPETYEGRPVAELRWDPPTQPVARADLARILPLPPGTPLHLALVRDAIKKLYATGNYSNIEIEALPAADGVTLVIHTTEQWFVGPVEVHGKVKLPPSEGQLANAARLELGTPFDEADLQTATEGVRGLLQRNGLYLAKIDPKIERDAEHQEVTLTFQVDSGKRARLTSPVIEGETGIAPDKVAKSAKYKGWFRWKPATDETSQAGLRNIRQQYNRQDRLTANVTLDHQDYLPDTNQVRPTITAEGGPRIKIRTEGAKVSKSKLQEYVPVFDEETVNRDLLVTGVRNLTDYFQNRGYFDVEVSFEQKDTGAGERDITYTIGLGERHKVVNVAIQGARYFKVDDIRERIYLHKAGFIRVRHGRYSEGFVRRDRDAIQALYRDSGFRDCKVAIETQDDYKGRKGDVGISVSIDEGPQYVVSALTLDGITRKDKSTIAQLLASQPGQPFSDTSVALDRNYIFDLYQAAGYPDVDFEYTASPAGAHLIGLTYTVKEGAPRYVRDVLITGLHVTRRRLVDPNILLKPGDPLSWIDMGTMQRRLYNLGVFDKVDMAVQNSDGDTQNKYVLYHLTEGHHYYMAVGAGAELARIGSGNQTSLDSGGATGFSPRGAFEFSRLNLWGLGHSLNLKTRYSTLDRRVSLNYLAPRYRNVEGRNLSFTALYDNTRDVLTFTARRLEGSAQISQRHSRATTFLWRYTWRDVKVDSSTLKINPLLIPLQSQAARIAMIGGSITYDRRDDPSDAHHGIYNSANVDLVEHFFGGNKNFLRFLGRSSYYKTILPDWVIASNTQVGWIRPFHVTPGVDPFDYIPIPEHFFGGGSTSMRGFPDNQAGPRDLLTGFPLGGNALFFHTTELRFPFLGENINGVIFHDMGNVYSDLGSISFRVHQHDIKDFNYMVHAAGFGIRYRTPVGPVRVDLAYSINPPAYFGLKGTYKQLLLGGATLTLQNVSHFQFFISIGQAF